MQVFKEQCSLALLRDTLVQEGGLYKGTFVPINPKTVNWIKPLIEFLNRNKNIAVEFGPTEKRRAIADIKNGIFTRSEFVGWLIMAPIDIDVVNLRFKFTMLPHGRMKEKIIESLNSNEPFIISAKSLTTHEQHRGNTYMTVTKVIGLETLPQEELEMSVPAETLKQITHANPTVDTTRIDTPRFINNDITLGNEDIAAVMKLNMAAGNLIDHGTEVPASAYEANIKRQTGIDLNECFELLEAYITGDVSLLRDALADKRVTLNGFQNFLPFSMIEDYRSAVKNNYTRFDTDYDRALETQAKYAKLGVVTVIQLVELEGETGEVEEFFVNKVAKECTSTTGEIFTKGKWVKSKYFTDDSFEHVEGLFEGQNDLHDNVKNITKRFTETYELVRRLTSDLGKAYTDKIREVTTAYDNK